MISIIFTQITDENLSTLLSKHLRYKKPNSFARFNMKRYAQEHTTLNGKIAQNVDSCRHPTYAEYGIHTPSFSLPTDTRSCYPFP